VGARWILLGSALVLSLGCNKATTRVLVRASNLPAQATRLEAAFVWNGRPATMLEEFTLSTAVVHGAATSFLVDLPSGGSFSTTLNAKDARGCTLSTGTSSTSVAEGELGQLSVTLAPASVVCSSDGGMNADLSPPPESDCLDGADDNGDGLVDCADPTCAGRAVCYDDPDELGVPVASGSCPTDWTASTPYYQGIVVPTTCSGCSCLTTTECEYLMSFFTTTDCSGTQAATATIAVIGDSTRPNEAQSTCTALSGTVFPTNAVKVTISGPWPGMCTSDGSAATPDPVTWQTTTTFCRPSRSSSSCGAGRVCAAPLPPQTAACVRVGAPDATCPAGYGGSAANYYTAQQYTDSRTCSCTCELLSSGTCTFSNTAFILGASCPNDVRADLFVTPAGGCITPVTAGPSINEVNYAGLAFGGGAATCRNLATVGGTATPTNGSTICCP
jgi:hypothetical protein